LLVAKGKYIIDNIVCEESIHLAYLAIITIITKSCSQLYPIEDYINLFINYLDLKIRTKWRETLCPKNCHFSIINDYTNNCNLIGVMTRIPMKFSLIIIQRRNNPFEDLWDSSLLYYIRTKFHIVEGELMNLIIINKMSLLSLQGKTLL
jgi:hypothetical protein